MNTLRNFCFITSVIAVFLQTNSSAQQVIHPGSLSFDPSLVSHGQEFATRRWAIDATGSVQSTNTGTNDVYYDYSASPNPYSNWSLGGTSQGPNNLLSVLFAGGNLTNVIDHTGAPITLVDGTEYAFAFAIKPTEFGMGLGNGTWAIGEGNEYQIDWAYAGNPVISTSVTLSADAWDVVSFLFTYEAGNDFAFITSTFDGLSTPSESRLTGAGGATPTINLDAPTLQFAVPTVASVPEPTAVAFTAVTVFFALFFRRRPGGC
ncbi:hypothetical protein FEM03_00470 [Phragmitibacter flavus]|uniref:Uncharacterized protein n=1 Tax=Phragmitibacter flavus TaxID=2576071 RepID=A0A5R8KJU3_9BACT|nr:hypothetical protein [Phragmitibacter flavus]TLD72584.1 hypothetical protein FEM03_00470 [Phragmitibacter flavus]